ncbi:MAG: ABC transporter permease [Dehalococcoidia bacterium]|nr:ABC transporter permease [Dehalococcoidia bacterium]
MRLYVIRRLLQFVPVMIAVSIIIFAIMRVLPGDVASLVISGPGGTAAGATPADIERVRKELGLDRPLPEQYLTWISGFVRLDAGNSIWTHSPVFDEISRRLPLTLELAVLTLLFSLLFALPAGILSAMRQDTWVDYFFRFFSVGGLTLPTFWTGTLVILALVLVFRWIPPIGFVNFWEDPFKNLQQMVWPAAVLGYYFSAVVSRMTRSSMLEVLRQDYVRTAWAKGLKEKVVVMRHAMANALLPVITISGMQFGQLLGGTVVTETIFSLPGMGSQLIDALVFRDYPIVQTVILIMSLWFLVVNLVVDLLYGLLDPRIRYS